MKKLLLLFAVAAVAMIGCEGTCKLYLVVKNQTDSEIIINIDGGKDLLVMPNDDELVDYIERLCDWGGGIPSNGGYEPQDIMITDAKMTIGDETIPDKIWMGEYWDFSLTTKYSATYTLTVTNELIESLLSDDKPTP